PVTPRRAALIGLGMAVTPHAHSLIELGDKVEVVSAVSPSARRRQAFAQRFAFALDDSLEAVVRNPSIDIAAVLTPPNTHLEIATPLAPAGQHILLAKPGGVFRARSPEHAR